MKLTLLLADSAQTSGDKVSALGIGWSRVPLPLPALAIILVVEAEQAEASEHKRVVVELCDTAGNLIRWPTSDTPAPTTDAPLAQFTADMQALEPVGNLIDDETVRMATAIQLPSGMPLAPGMYQFQARIDGAAHATVHQRFRVMEPAE